MVNGHTYLMYDQPAALPIGSHAITRLEKVSLDEAKPGDIQNVAMNYSDAALMHYLLPLEGNTNRFRGTCLLRKK